MGVIAAFLSGLSEPAPAADQVLLRNGGFEGSLRWWRGQHATLSRISDGVGGGHAARVSVSGARKAFSIYPSPRPVSSTRAGTVYQANAWYRSRSRVRVLCIHIREWSRSGSLVAAAKRCRASTARWASFGVVSHAARAATNQLDVSVYAQRAAAGARFDVDRIRLTAAGSSPATDPFASPTAGDSPYLAADWRNGFRTWARTTIPDATWRPFAAESPFNRPIPASPRLMTNSTQIVQRLYGMDGNPLTKSPQNLDLDPSLENARGTGHDYAHPIYFASLGDPLYTINCIRYACPDLQGRAFPIPAEAKAADGGDGHLGVVIRRPGHPQDLFVLDLYRAWNKPAGGGRYDIGSGGISRIDGDGTTVDIDASYNLIGDIGRSEATAARFSVLAGVVRAPHIQSGRIPHAIFFTANCDSGAFVYPAERPGRACSAIGNSNVNAPPMGARLWLDMSAAEINALKIKKTLRIMLKALNEFGAYMGDTGGGGYGWGFESPETYHAWGRQTPLVDIAQQEGWPVYEGRYVLKPSEVPSVVWEHLKILDPCTAKGTC